MPRKVTLSAIQPPLLRRDSLQAAQAAHLEVVTDLLLEAASRSTDLAVLTEHLNLAGAPSVRPEPGVSPLGTVEGRTYIA